MQYGLARSNVTSLTSTSSVRLTWTEIALLACACITARGVCLKACAPRRANMVRVGDNK